MAAMTMRISASGTRTTQIAESTKAELKLDMSLDSVLDLMVAWEDVKAWFKKMWARV